MVIRHEDENGGRFSGPLWLNVNLSFTPEGRASREALELPAEVRFPANAEYPWRSKAAAPVPAGFVLVDTDGDRVPDTYLPGTSNFFAGQSSRPASGRPGAPEKSGVYCHIDGDDQHCVNLCDLCQIP